MHAVELKYRDDGTPVIAGYGVVFGGRDLDGDTFTPETNFGRMVDLPVFYDHAQQSVKALDNEIGRVISTKRDEIGVWFEAELDKSHEYINDVLELVKRGVAGLSTGAVSHLVRRDEQKHIKRWPVAELSVTVTPAEPRTLGVAQIKATSGDLETAEGAAEAETQSAPDTSGEPVADHRIEVAQEGEPIMAEDIKQAAEQAADPGAEVKALREEMAALRAELTTPVKAVGYAAEAAPEADPEAEAVKAFKTYVHTGKAAKALSRGTDSAGGFAIPNQYSDQLIAAIRESSVLRMAGARVFSVREAKQWFALAQSDSTTAVLTAEAAAFAEADPSLAQIAFTPYKYTIQNRVSDELLADSMIDVVSAMLVPSAANAFVLAENTAFTTGSGSGQPQGVLTGGSLGKTAASATAITVAELTDLYHAVHPSLRGNAKWMMSDAVLAYLRKLNDSTGRPLLQPNAYGVPESTIWGRPIVINSNMPTAITTGQKTVVFGDFSYFWICDFADLEMRRLDELYAATGQVGFQWYKRFDSRVMLSSAVKWLAQA